MNNQPYLIKALSPADLREQVIEALQANHDLHGGSFVSHEGLICQLAYPVKSWWDYALIVAGDLDDYERQIIAYSQSGFEPYQSVLLWNNQWYLQWMYRMGDGKLIVSMRATAQAQPVVEGAPAGVRLAEYETMTSLNLPVDLS